MMNESYNNNKQPMINPIFTPINSPSAFYPYIKSTTSNQQSIYSQRIAYTAKCLKLAEREDISCEERAKHLQEAKKNIYETEEIYFRDSNATESPMEKTQTFSEIGTTLKGIASIVGLFFAAKEFYDDYNNYFFC